MRIALILLSLLVFACTDHHEPSTRSVAQNETVRDAVLALGARIDARTATSADVVPVLDLATGDAYAMHELDEIQALLTYGEFSHASHGVSFLDAYVSTGNQVLCPGHALAHYFVFARNGDEHRAQHAREEAHEQWADWQREAKSYSQQYPGAESYEQTRERLRVFLDQADEGVTTVSESDLTYLVQALCVEQS